MAELFNDQRVVGVHLVEDGTTMHNGLPVIGIVDAAGATFAGNQRVLGVDLLSGGELIHNDQSVLGAVLIEDGRALYNHQLVIPVRALSGTL